MIERVKNSLLVLGIATIMFAFIFIIFWLVKNGSYYFFYQDMVEQTIRELVLQSALK